MQGCGCSDVELGASVAGHQDLPLGEGGLMGRRAFTANAKTRRSVWSSESSCQQGVPLVALRSPAADEHACNQFAAERNWSLLGNLYRKNRSKLLLTRAEKLVFISSTAKARRADRKSSEEREIELLCSDVDAERAFGNQSTVIDLLLE